MRWHKAKRLSTDQFQRRFGIKRVLFDKMVEVIQSEQREHPAQNSRGRPKALTVKDGLLLMLGYYREYRTLFHLATDYGVSEATAWRIVRQYEQILIQSKIFHLPGKKKLSASQFNYEVVLIDATETPIERPKKKQRKYYSGKKKRHSLKTQMVLNRTTRQIICTAYGNGSQHDFSLYKQSRLALCCSTSAQVDSGYQGLQKLHAQTQMPYKNTKLHPLTKEQKRANTTLSSSRVLIEHVIRKLKIFKIVSEKYRNRKKRFGLRMNLIAGWYNYQLVL
ncbi:MAG: IS5 family transposase [Nitrospirota bacterium]